MYHGCVCVLCVEPVLEVERGIKIAVGKPRKAQENGWKQNNKER